MEALTGGHDAAIQMIDSLAWKPDDERGAKWSARGKSRASARCVAEFFPNGGALHALEHGLGRMLKRDAQ